MRAQKLQVFPLRVFFSDCYPRIQVSPLVVVPTPPPRSVSPCFPSREMRPIDALDSVRAAEPVNVVFGLLPVFAQARRSGT